MELGSTKTRTADTNDRNSSFSDHVKDEEMEDEENIGVGSEASIVVDPSIVTDLYQRLKADMMCRRNSGHNASNRLAIMNKNQIPEESLPTTEDQRVLAASPSGLGTSTGRHRRLARRRSYGAKSDSATESRGSHGDELEGSDFLVTEEVTIDGTTDIHDEMFVPTTTTTNHVSQRDDDEGFRSNEYSEDDKNGVVNTVNLLTSSQSITNFTDGSQSAKSDRVLRKNTVCIDGIFEDELCEPCIVKDASYTNDDSTTKVKEEGVSLITSQSARGKRLHSETVKFNRCCGSVVVDGGVDISNGCYSTENGDDGNRDSSRKYIEDHCVSQPKRLKTEEEMEERDEEAKDVGGHLVDIEENHFIANGVDEAVVYGNAMRCEVVLCSEKDTENKDDLVVDLNQLIANRTGVGCGELPSSLESNTVRKSDRGVDYKYLMANADSVVDIKSEDVTNSISLTGGNGVSSTTNATTADFLKNDQMEASHVLLSLNNEI